MTFVILLLALLTERFLLDQHNWRQAGWFNQYINKVIQSEYGAWVTSRYWGAIIVLAPILLLLGIAQSYVADEMGQLFSFLFAFGVVLYCLGPDNLDNQAADFIDAQERDDKVRSNLFAGKLCECEPSESPSERIHQVSNAIMFQANQRIFAVVLWFLILGPLGAVLYRLTRHLHNYDIDAEESGIFKDGARKLLYILDWLPARATDLSYAIAGDFEHTLSSWNKWKEEKSETTFEETRELLIQAGNGALLLHEKGEDETETSQVEATLSLVWRALVVWLIVLGLIAISL